MNRNYYFTDETGLFRQPAQPEKGQTVRLRFQTAQADTVRIWLRHGEDRLPLKQAETMGDRTFYEVEVTPEEEEYRYYYEIRELVPAAFLKTMKEDGRTLPSYGSYSYMKEREQSLVKIPAKAVYYDKRGLVTEPDPAYFFTIRPGYVIPDWLQGAVMYQIFTDRFRDGDNRNDVQDREYHYLEETPVERVHNWSERPKMLDVSRFYGGDLPGIREKLDYLQDLGVEVLYLNPIFVSPSNHKYDSQDYDNVDPHLTLIAKDGGELLPAGCTDNSRATRYRLRITDPENLKASNEYFADFVSEIHARGMKIILDGVFNHCGSFHRWMDREGFYHDETLPEEELGAWKNPDSRYRDYFSFRKDGSYECWWDMKTLPKLNYEESENLQKDILRIAAKWVSPPYNIDGWRLDVAADLGHTPEFNHRFWKEFRRTVKEVNPRAVILAEHYGDPSPWLKGEEWDTIMNYDAFMEPVSWFLTGMEKHSDSYRGDLDGNAEAFWSSMEKNMAHFSFGSLHGAMNQLDNHDHSRFITRTNRMVGRLRTVGSDAAEIGLDRSILRQAVILQMTWPGAPTLYYGDETCVPGWTDPDNRRTYPWGSEDWQIIEFYKYAIGIRRSITACRNGSLVRLHVGEGVVAFGRFDESSQMVTVVNASDEARALKLDLSVMGEVDTEPWYRIMHTNSTGYNVGRVKCRLPEKILEIVSEPHSASVYRSQSSWTGGRVGYDR